MITVLIILLIFVVLIVGLKKLGEYDNPKLFRSFVKRYQRQDKIHFPEPGAIVFTGSSVVKFWKTMETDLSPFYVINRGIAGTKIHEVAYWLDGLVIGYRPKAVVLYAGSNDIQGKNPKTPEHVLHGFILFSEKLHKALPNTPLIFLSIIPCPAKTRWAHWDSIQKANSLIKDYCGQHGYMQYIDTTADFLDPNGLPDRSLFKKDGIHLNGSGYRIWTAALRPVLSQL